MKNKAHINASIYSLFITWFIWLEETDNNLLVAIICIAITYLLSRYLGLFSTHIKFSYRLLLYYLWLIKEIFKSSFNVICIIWSKKLNLTPTFEWIHVENNINQAELVLVLYGNSITLTPGTFTAAVKNDRLLVHSLQKPMIEDLQLGEMICKVKSALVEY